MFAPRGAGFGLLHGFVDGLGPPKAPCFLAAGPLRVACLGTDALATVAEQGAELRAFGARDLLAGTVLDSGLPVVPFMVPGS